MTISLLAPLARFYGELALVQLLRSQDMDLPVLRFLVQPFQKIAAGNSIETAVGDERQIDAQHPRRILAGIGDFPNRENMGSGADFGSEVADGEAIADHLFEHRVLAGRI